MEAPIDMFTLNGFIKRLLRLETLLTIGVTIVMGGVIYFSITNQREHIRERMTTHAQDMKLLAYAGIKHPMAVGDSPSIEKQLLDIGDELKHTEIVICDFNQRIVFATKGRGLDRGAGPVPAAVAGHRHSAAHQLF